MPRRFNAYPSRPRANRRTSSSAAAFMGVIGLPDPGHGPRLHDGGLDTFCRQFNQAADAFLGTREARAQRARAEGLNAERLTNPHSAFRNPQ